MNIKNKNLMRPLLKFPMKLLYVPVYYAFFVFFKAVAAMVEECCKFVDQTPNLDTKLKLIDTLRTVSEGKVRYFMYCIFRLNFCLESTRLLECIHTCMYIHIRTRTCICTDVQCSYVYF